MLIINFEGREAKGLSKVDTTKPSLVKIVPVCSIVCMYVCSHVFSVLSVDTGSKFFH